MDDLTDDEIDAIVMGAVGDLLNIAAIVAELQATDEAAADIYAICDLVAEYHGIERVDLQDTTELEPSTRTEPIPGSITTKNKPKFRVVDYKPKK